MTTFGHDVGDPVLAELARRLERVVPPGTFLARMEADAFAAAVVCEGLRCARTTVELSTQAGTPRAVPAHGRNADPHHRERGCRHGTGRRRRRAVAGCPSPQRSGRGRGGGRLEQQLTVDDFGTGYGGFTYLKRLPVQRLKIEIEFVQDLRRSAASHHVVGAVVDLAPATPA